MFKFHASQVLRIAVIGMLGGALVVLVAMLNFQRCVEIYASHALGRQVTAKKIDWSSRPLRFELEELHVANTSWGSQPDILFIHRMTAEPDIKSLFKGDVLFRRLDIEHARLLLEHDEQGRGNWKGADDVSSSASPEREAADSRKNFPIILDATIHDSGILMITSSKTRLPIDFHHAHIRAEDAASPVSIEVSGAYKNIPVDMLVRTNSYTALRNVGTQFPVTIHAQGKGVIIDASLAMMDPLGFDQFTGAMTLTAEDLGRASAFFGPAFRWNLPLNLANDISRQGDDWVFENAKGRLGHNSYDNSRVKLKLGDHDTPDALDSETYFETLNAAELADAARDPATGPKQAKSFEIESNPMTLLNAAVTARRLSYRSLYATQARLHAIVAKEKAGLQDVSMNFFGGTLRGSVMAEKQDKATRITLQGLASHIGVEKIVRVIAPRPRYTIRGEASARLQATARSDVPDILQTVDGHFSLSLANGRISRQLIRIASTDIRAALHSDATIIPISCLTARAHFARGVSTDTMFRLNTPEGSLLGAGSLDLARQQMDLSFQTQSETTSSYAADLPVRLSGPISDPHIGIAAAPAASPQRQIPSAPCGPGF